MKLTTQLNKFTKLFPQREKENLIKLVEFDKQFKPSEKGYYPDPAQIAAIEFTNKELERLFFETHEPPMELRVNPKIKFSGYGLFTMDYLKDIVEMFSGYSHVQIYLGINQPIRVACKDFDVMLAPRINDEDEKIGEEIKENLIEEILNYVSIDRLKKELKNRNKKIKGVKNAKKTKKA